MFPKIVFEKISRKLSPYSVSRIVPEKKRKVAGYRRNEKIEVSFKKWSKMIRSLFLRTCLRFHSALAILEPQI